MPPPTPSGARKDRKRRRAVRHGLLALLAVAVVATHHSLSSSWQYSAAADDAATNHLARRTALDQAPDSLAQLGVPRAHQVVQLEKYADADTRLGLCHAGVPAFHDVPARVCKELQCIWSEALHRKVDMWLTPLVSLPDHAVTAACAPPSGGQRGVPPGTRPLLSFVLTMHNHVNVTMQSLLELYRTAAEVPSAEFVLVDDGSTDDTAPVQDMLRLLRAYFGVTYVYVRNEQPAGYGAANTQGIALASGEFVALINSDA
jgi:hypothetical protein